MEKYIYLFPSCLKIYSGHVKYDSHLIVSWAMAASTCAESCCGSIQVKSLICSYIEFLWYPQLLTVHIELYDIVIDGSKKFAPRYYYSYVATWNGEISQVLLYVNVLHLFFGKWMVPCKSSFNCPVICPFIFTMTLLVPIF